MSKLKIDKRKIRQLADRKLQPTKNPFQSLVRSIIFQQLSGKAATSILNKFNNLFLGQSYSRLSGRTRNTRFSPKPEDVLSLSDSQFRSAGVSLQKANYLRDLSSKFIDKTINPKHFHKMSDQDIIDHLVQVKGIGEWTAHMFLIFALNRPDVLPTGDLAIRKGFMKVFNLRSVPTHEKMVLLAKPHKGERTYLSLHLWGIMDDEKKKK